MIKRCTSKNHKYYKLYWWRWIKCLWTSYVSFKRDMYESYLDHVAKYWEKDTTLDRIDGNWNYCKENCRRATKVEQGRNTMRNKRYKRRWWEYTLKEIYEMENINIAYKTFAWRVYSKWWTIEESITTPFINQEHRYDWKWWKYILKEIYDMEKPPIWYWTFISRIYQSKWSIEDAINKPIVEWFWNKLLFANKIKNA